MGYLWLATFIWGFSFSLIGVFLLNVDAYFVAFVRTLLACLVFLPLLRLHLLNKGDCLKLMGIGSIQLGFMYLFYHQAFHFLTVPELLLFITFTPIYITLFNDLLEKKFHKNRFWAVLLAVLGAVIIRYHNINQHFMIGFVLIQLANIVTAIGQICYRRLFMNKLTQISQYQIFGWFHLGALPITFLSFILLGNVSKIEVNLEQVLVLLWLGVMASGVGYYLWNRGACLVNAGTLSILHNALIPVGLLINIVIWNHHVNFFRLAMGGMVIGLSLLVNEYIARKLDQAKLKG